jgi:hypothetical protein
MTGPSAAMTDVRVAASEDGKVIKHAQVEVKKKLTIAKVVNDEREVWETRMPGMVTRRELEQLQTSVMVG